MFMKGSFPKRGKGISIKGRDVWKEEKAFTGFTQFSYPEYRGSKLL
jgi:hypothetical protein